MTIDLDEYGKPVTDPYKRLGAGGNKAGLYVRFEPGFGLNVYIGHRHPVGDQMKDDPKELGMSIQGWEYLCALVDEWRSRAHQTNSSVAPEEG